MNPAARPRLRRGPAPAAPAQSRERPSILAALLIWVMLIVMIVPDGFSYAEMASNSMPTEGSAFSRTIWLTLLAFGAGVPLSKSGMALKLLRQVNPYLLLFCGLVAASILWSIDPGVTLRRFVRITTTVLMALAFVMMGWRTTRFQDVVRPFITIMLVGSIVFVELAPDLAVERGDTAALLGAWHGLSTQKNGLGSLAVIGLILWLHGWLSKEKPVWEAVPGIGVCLICLIKSKSSSSIMCAAFSCVFMLLLLRPPVGLRRYLPYMIVLFASTLLVYSLAVLNLIPGSGTLLSPITMLTGKDQTFSGRTAIWAIVNRHIALRPLLGSGYGAYWVMLPGSPSMEMLDTLYYYPTEGHNGYLDIINDLGVVGALCLLGYLVTYLRQGMRLLVTVRLQGALYLTLLFQQLVANLTESRWLNVLTCEFTILTIATLAMGRTLLDQRMQQRSSAPVNRVPAAPANSANPARAPRSAARRGVLGPRKL